MISRAAIEAAKKAAIAKAAEIDQTSVDTLDEENDRHLEAVLQAGLSAALAAEGMALVPVEALSYARQMSNLCFNYKQSSCFDEKTRRNFDEVQSGFDRAMLKAAGASDG